MTEHSEMPIAEGERSAPLEVWVFFVSSSLPAQVHGKGVGWGGQLNLLRSEKPARVGGLAGAPVRHVIVRCDVATWMEHHGLDVARVDHRGGERELAPTGREWTYVGAGLIECFDRRPNVRR